MLPLIALLILLLMTFCRPPPVPVAPTQIGGARIVYLPMAHGGPLVTPWKKGVALNSFRCEDAFRVGATWAYNWNATIPSCFGIESVPMIWGRLIPETLGGNSAWLLGFNEPDRPDQANMPPAEAAELWRIVEERFWWRKLVAPVPSDADKEWIVRFRDAYLALYGVPPRMDALAMHCYRYVDSCILIAQWYLDRAAEWGVPEVWATEWAFEDPASYPIFMDWMEAQPRVTHYAAYATSVEMGSWYWTGSYDPSLLSPDGSLTNLGKVYTGEQ